MTPYAPVGLRAAECLVLLAGDKTISDSLVDRGMVLYLLDTIIFQQGKHSYDIGSSCSSVDSSSNCGHRSCCSISVSISKFTHSS